MALINNNGTIYCDCLDWADWFKTAQLQYMTEYEQQLHTTGVADLSRESVAA